MRIKLAEHDSGQVFLYEALNLPPGEEAYIQDCGGCYQSRWRVLRIKHGLSSHWAGNYATAPEALAALSEPTQN